MVCYKNNKKDNNFTHLGTLDDINRAERLLEVRLVDLRLTARRFTISV